MHLAPMSFAHLGGHHDQCKPCGCGRVPG